MKATKQVYNAQTGETTTEEIDFIPGEGAALEALKDKGINFIKLKKVLKEAGIIDQNSEIEPDEAVV